MRATAAAIIEGSTDTDKVKQILRSARDSFLQHGYGATSMDAIARAAAVSKATLYVFFASKHELFAAVIVEERDRYAVSLLAGEGSREPIRVKLTRFGQAIVDFLISEETVASSRMVIGEAGRVPELGQVFYRNGPTKLLDRLETFMAASMRSGALRATEPRRAAEHLIGLVRGDLQLRALLGVTDGLSCDHVKAVIRDGVDTFYRAYRPTMRSSSTATPPS